jgi:hypothetical protein
MDERRNLDFLGKNNQGNESFTEIAKMLHLTFAAQTAISLKKTLFFFFLNQIYVMKLTRVLIRNA